MRRELFPVFCGSAFELHGVRSLLQKVVELVPNPTERPEIRATRPARTRRSSSLPTAIRRPPRSSSRPRPSRMSASCRISASSAARWRAGRTCGTRLGSTTRDWPTSESCRGRTGRRSRTCRAATSGSCPSSRRPIRRHALRARASRPSPRHRLPDAGDRRRHRARQREEKRSGTPSRSCTRRIRRSSTPTIRSSARRSSAEWASSTCRSCSSAWIGNST